MAGPDKSLPIPTDFPKFGSFPSEIRLHIWSCVLPGPRIIYVQRLLTSGQDVASEWTSWDHAGQPPLLQATYFAAITRDSIAALTQTCRESRGLVMERYTLLFPASSTWFAFSSDFLFLDFGRSPHTVPYSARTFTSSEGDQPDDDNINGDFTRNARLLSWMYRRCPKHYLRPKFNGDLVSKVKNIAIVRQAYISPHHGEEQAQLNFLREFWEIFTGVEVLVLADPLYNPCHEISNGEELVWIRGDLGDEMSCADLFVDEVGQSYDLQKEQWYLQVMRGLALWPDFHLIFEDEVLARFLQQRERWTLPSLPRVVRKGITTAKAKKRLLEICGSEDNFPALKGVCESVDTGTGYGGSLNEAQQYSFLCLLHERWVADFEGECQACDEATLRTGYEGGIYEFKYSVTQWAFGEVVLREAEEIVWK